MKIDWLANSIKIDSVEDLQEFLNLGFEIRGKTFTFENNIGEIKIALERDGEQVIIEANEIYEYAASLLELYDFDKRKPIFKPVPKSEIYWEFESRLSMMATEEYKKPILTRQLETINSGSILNQIQSWMSREKYMFYPLTRLSEVFSLIYIIKEKENQLTTSIVSKDIFEIEELSDVYKEAKESDISIALSFFFLSNKISSPESFEDAIFGISVYDLKNRQILAFNVLSLIYFIRKNIIDSKLGFLDIAKFLLEKSLVLNKQGLIFRSYIPLTLDTPFYTVFPWFIYAAISNPSLDPNMEDLIFISIPEFFVFGLASLANVGNSFDYSKFSSSREGHASIIMNFNYRQRALTYVLRFDQSRGEPLVHIDFSYFHPSENKLISHRPLNMIEVSNFNLDLFISMMAAGLYDGDFNTLVKNGFKGINELQKQNPAFLYTFNIIYKIEKWLKWLNANPLGYELLEKLYYVKELDEAEKDFLKYMANETRIGDFKMFIQDEDGNVKGLNQFGYMVLMRFKTNQHNTIVT